jgi:hypothetical protein
VIQQNLSFGIDVDESPSLAKGKLLRVKEKYCNVAVSTEIWYCSDCMAYHQSKSQHNITRTRLSDLYAIKLSKAIIDKYGLSRFLNSVAVGLTLLEIASPGIIEFLFNLGFRAWDYFTSVDFLKDVGDIAKTHWFSFEASVHLHPSYFIDLYQICGYSAVPLKIDKNKMAFDFFHKGRNTECFDFEDFFSFFEQHIDHYNINQKRVSDRPQSLKDYIQNYSETWATHGSSKLIKTYVDGKRVQMTKSSLYLMYDTEEILNAIQKGSVSTFTPVIKQDPGKHRMAFGSDTVTFFLMSYVYYPILASGLPTPTTLLMDKDEMNKFEQNIKLDIASGNNFFVPFDFSAFDHQISKKEVMFCIEHMYKYLRESGLLLPNGEIYYLKLKTMLENGIFINHEDNYHTSWENGLPSGLRLTAEIGTLMSYMWSVYVMKLYDIKFKYIYTQGDDCIVCFEKYEDALFYVQYMGAIGFEFNPHKFFLSNKRSEFLRKMYVGKDIYQPVARSIRALTQSKPWRETRIEKLRGQELVKNIIDYYTRSQSSRLPQYFVKKLIKKTITTYIPQASKINSVFPNAMGISWNIKLISTKVIEHRKLIYPNTKIKKISVYNKIIQRYPDEDWLSGYRDIIENNNEETVKAILYTPSMRFWPNLVEKQLAFNTMAIDNTHLVARYKYYFQYYSMEDRIITDKSYGCFSAFGELRNIAIRYIADYKENITFVDSKFNQAYHKYISLAKHNSKSFALDWCNGSFGFNYSLDLDLKIDQELLFKLYRMYVSANLYRKRWTIAGFNVGYYSFARDFALFFKTEDFFRLSSMFNDV